MISFTFGIPNVFQFDWDILKDEGDQKSDVTDHADDLLQVQAPTGFAGVGISSHLTQVSFNLDVWNVCDDERRVSMREEIRRKRNFFCNDFEGILWKGDTAYGQPQKIKAVDVHVTFVFVARISGDHQRETFDKEKVQSEANQGQ